MNRHDRLGEKISALELEAEMTAIIQEEVGFNDTFAGQIAQAITRGMRRRMGGQEIYVPSEDKSQRNAAIKAEFNGRNRDEIIRKYSISRTTLYEIVSKP